MRRFLSRRFLGSVVLGIVGLVVGGLAVSALREATLSTHQRIDRDSTIELVVRASTHSGEQDQSLAEMVEAQLLYCRLEVASDVVGDIERTSDPRRGDDVGDNDEAFEVVPNDGDDEGFFRATLAPSMDQTNRRQFKGCVEDFVTDHVQMDVIRFSEL